MGENVNEAGSVNEKFAAGIEAPKKMKVRTANVSGASTDLRVTININESDDSQDADNEVPVQVNGRAYQIKRGQDVAVPPEVVVALENAVVDKAIPMKDENGMTRGFTLRPAKRFPFRIVDEQSMAILKAWKGESIARRDAGIEAEREAA
jgi:hypothetical protein